MKNKKSIKDIIVSYLQDDVTETELRKLKVFIERSDENARYYARVKDLWESSVTNTNQIAETEKEWYKFLSNIRKTDSDSQFIFFRSKTKFQLIYRFAAILIIGIVIGALVVKFSFNQEPQFITYVAPKGSVSQMILPDSTLVYLNAGSQIKYTPKAGNANREVFLKGEAWFDVLNDGKKKFVVHTPYYDVNVTGTKFNVKAYDEDSEVTTTLEEGEVIIASSGNYRLNQNIILSRGEQMILYKNSNTFQVRDVDTQLYTSWKDNKLIFLNMSFGELIVLLERRYGVDIKVNNPDILKYHYTGTIKNETILEILEIIQHTLPIEIEIVGQEIQINNQ